MDNARIHKTKEILKIIKDSKNFVVYTVPYHPRLNTIEQFFNQMKHYIKLDKPMSYKKLEDSLKNSIKRIKKEHYKNYFIYAYNKKSYKNKKNKRKIIKPVFKMRSALNHIFFLNLVLYH